jgi:hypothetical protein
MYIIGTSLIVPGVRLPARRRPRAGQLGSAAQRPRVRSRDSRSGDVMGACLPSSISRPSWPGSSWRPGTRTGPAPSSPPSHLPTSRFTAPRAIIPTPDSQRCSARGGVAHRLRRTTRNEGLSHTWQGQGPLPQRDVCRLRRKRQVTQVPQGDQPWMSGSARSSAARIWPSRSMPSWRPFGSWSSRSQRHVAWPRPWRATPLMCPSSFGPAFLSVVEDQSADIVPQPLVIQYELAVPSPGRRHRLFYQHMLAVPVTR